jgi:hypothetical protein
VTTYNAWIVTTPDGSPVPMLAYSPELGIGVAPGINGCGPVWFNVDPRGVPLPPAIAAPTGPVADLLVWRLSQAYAALMCAERNCIAAKA